MLKIVVLTGAGISADSGIPTYRSSDGLWANYKIEEVCTPEALERDRAKVINFYNMRRKDMAGKLPNAGHKALAELEKYFDVEIVTQNIDNLHEAAGSTKITHLHGELTKLRLLQMAHCCAHILYSSVRLCRCSTKQEIWSRKLIY